jgi:2-polyprenyl-3-methyl-5-hydroxy-6-metoxy-1,4-benzoquinol methylase
MPFYVSCPVCAHITLSTYSTVEDYSVSHEKFELVQCTQCQLVLTQQAPDKEAAAPYYQFEDYISHSDTQKGLINKLYHAVRKITLAQKRKLVKKYTHLNKGAVLDIGSGTGAFLHSMQTAQWRILGLEPDAATRQKAKKKYGVNTYEPDHLYTLPKAAFNAITLWHVLEHVHDLQAYMQQLPTLLKPNGKLFIAVPNYTSYDANYYKTYWAAYDVPRHLYHFAPESLRQLAQKNGLEIEAYKPMWFDSFYISMLSEKYKKGNIIRAVWIAFVSNGKALLNKQKCCSIIYILKNK